MSNPLPVTMHTLGAETASGQGSSVDISAIRTVAQLELVVAAVSGTLTVSVQTSPDGTNWRTVATFAAATAAGKWSQSIEGLDKYVRAAWTLSAAGTATFSVTGEAHVVYVTLAQLATLAIQSKAFTGRTMTEKVDALIAATGEADGYLGIQFQLPLTTWPWSLRRNVATIAAYICMNARGRNPEGDALDKLYDDAIGWLRDLAKGLISHQDFTDATPTVDDGGVITYCKTPRYW